MAHVLDLTGQRYGRLVVVKLAAKRTFDRKARWVCRCDCGAMTTIDAGNLRSGSTTSCGCYRRERMGELTARHHQSKTPEHEAWRQMRHRCSNPRSRNWRNYGARGITVCHEWNSFERFYADMGPRPSSQHSLDRKHNDGPYSPDNCRWALTEEQQNNRRCSTRLTFRERTMTITQWARKIGMSAPALKARLEDGWSIENALTTPVAIYQSHLRLTH